jgi:hypothetical protein
MRPEPQWIIWSSALFLAVFAFLTTALLIEWMAGCGETYVNAAGVRQAYECVFIPR